MLNHIILQQKLYNTEMGCTHSTEAEKSQSSRTRGKSVYLGNRDAKTASGSKDFSNGGGKRGTMNHGGKQCGLVNEQMPQSSSEGRFGNAKVRYAYFSKRGFYPDDSRKPNQDSFAISLEKFADVENHVMLSVFDGHGPDGHSCAWFARDHLHKKFGNVYRKAIDKVKADVLPLSTYKQVSTHAHKKTNEDLRASRLANDLLSGTTAVSVCFYNDYIIVSNVGDSRVILGEEKDDSITATNLSFDQTPFRKDERDRVKKAGALVRSLDQLDGLEPIHENWHVDENGELLDENGDPPRLWHKDGEYPGCAFTRSLGDSLAEEIGVYAEPELHHRVLKKSDKMLIIASDGVFEFLSSQAIVDMCAEHVDPLDACQTICQTAYDEWLKRETRTDDITMICVFIDDIVGADEEENGEE